MSHEAIDEAAVFKDIADFFAAPGLVRVSPPALELARAFAAEAAARQAGEDFVVAFDWADSRIVRKPKFGPRVELGPGLDLVAYERAVLPTGVTQVVDNVEFAVKIPGHIVEQREEKLIDTEGTSPERLILR